jgi:hypothetical protein
VLPAFVASSIHKRMVIPNIFCEDGLVDTYLWRKTEEKRKAIGWPVKLISNAF